MNKLYVVMGKSAAGKDTLFKRLLEDASLNLTTLVGYTTRPIRSSETEGVEYHFVTEARLEELRREGKVIEERVYQTTSGPWYYFLAEDGQMEDESKDHIIINTLAGYEKTLEYYKGKKEIIPLYIEVSDFDRLNRSLLREKNQVNPNYKEVCRRYIADEEDFCEENLQRLHITTRFENLDMEKCLESLKEHIKAGV